MQCLDSRIKLSPHLSNDSLKVGSAQSTHNWTGQSQVMSRGLRLVHFNVQLKGSSKELFVPFYFLFFSGLVLNLFL